MVEAIYQVKAQKRLSGDFIVMNGDERVCKYTSTCSIICSFIANISYYIQMVPLEEVVGCQITSSGKNLHP